MNNELPTFAGGMPRVLRFLLDEHHQTVADLSRATGIPRQTLSAWLSGRKIQDLHDARKIARHFKVSFEYLVFGEVDGVTGLIEALPLEKMFEGLLRVKIERVVHGSNACDIDKAKN